MHVRVPISKNKKNKTKIKKNEEKNTAQSPDKQPIVAIVVAVSLQNEQNYDKIYIKKKIPQHITGDMLR